MSEINPLLREMVARRRLSETKQIWLISLKEFIDRIAKEPYTPKEVAQNIEKKYGVLPDLLTWGDYFQVTLAKNYWEIADEDFIAECQKLMQDLLLAMINFSTKDERYRQEVKNSFFRELAKPSKERDAAILYEAQLCFYYEEMGLNAQNLTLSDWQWYFPHGFKKAV